MDRRILAVEADWHSNNRYGLLNPDTVLQAQDEDGRFSPYAPSVVPVQKFLWELREQNIEEMVRIADGDEIVFFHLGDPSQGWKHNTEYVSNTVYNEHAITVENARPIFEIPNVSIGRFVIGTEAHEGVGGSNVKLLYDQLRAEFPEKDITYIYHGLANIDSVRVDYTHHGPTTGLRKWTEGNQLRYYLKDIMMTDLLNDKTPADIFFRGHVHRRAWETVRIELEDRWVRSDIIVVPSMCDMGAFARQITRSENRITNGMVLLEIINDKLHDIHWLTVTRDLRAREIL